MFVRELENYAITLAEKASLAYSNIAKARPIEGFKWMSDVCSEASDIDRKFPGFYATFLVELNARKS